MSNYSLRRITDATSEPVSLAEARAHIEQNNNYADDVITRQIKSARHAIELEIGRPIGLQVWELGLRQWPMARPLEFPRPPLIALQSIKYLCEDGLNRVLFDATSSPQIPCSEFIVDASGDPGELWLTQTGQWPIEQLANGFPVRMRFQCGLVDYDEDLKTAILMLVAHTFENREAFVIESGVSAAIELPMGVKNHCAKYLYRVMG